MNNSKIRLCGGSFFTLLLNARRPRNNTRKKVLSGTDGLSNVEMLAALFRVAFPDYIKPNEESFDTICSNYKSCQISQSQFFPFNDKLRVKYFNEDFLTAYDEFAFRITDFIDKFISPTYCTYLVLELLKLIKNDDTIPSNALFYCDQKCTPISKTALLNIPEITVETFILGIWHYIIVNVSNNNILKESYDSWVQDIINDKAKPDTTILGSNSSIGIKHFDRQLDAISFPMPEKPKEIVSNFDPFQRYIQKAYDKYSIVKIFMYDNEPVPFYDFYVPSDVAPNIISYYFKEDSRYSPDSLATKKIYTFLTGTGGIGKSMMLRHLLLLSLKQYPENRIIPFFIRLKDYDPSSSSFIDFIYSYVSALTDNVDKETFEKYIYYGDTLLLLDGYDEIKSKYIGVFQRQLEDFIDKNPKVSVIITSRPQMGFSSFHRFHVQSICPLTKTQAIELITKLRFRPDDPTIKEAFLKELNSSLYSKHKDFAENPLLLSIMLITYEEYADIPDKMHIFYSDAYIALSRRHDKNKGGGFRRSFKTGLSAEDFKEYFAEFCARTYAAQKYEFTRDEFEQFFDNLNLVKKADYLDFDVDDFLYDLQMHLCLIYDEGRKFHFTHRSFQEYFCAYYFSKQKDKNLTYIGRIFEEGSRSFTDKTFPMLHDMIPDKVDEYIILPFLKTFFEKNNTYELYLINEHIRFYYYTGHVSDFPALTSHASYIISFLTRNEFFIDDAEVIDYPALDSFVYSKYVYYDSDWKSKIQEDRNGATIWTDELDSELCDLDDIEDFDEYCFRTGESDEIVGTMFKVELKDIFCDHLPDDINAEDAIIFESIICAPDYPLRMEYEFLKEYYYGLKNKTENVPANVDDIFDLL